MKAGVILTARFNEAGKTGSKGGYGGYTDYLDRPDATEFKDYNDYMDDSEKSEGIFTESTDKITKTEKKEMKDLFKLAEKNGSILEKLVFSFDNEFLEKHDIKTKDGLVRTELLMEYTRKSIATMKKVDKSFDNFIWTGAVHHNTEHLHIHIAMVEPNPSWKVGEGRCFDFMGKEAQRGIIKNGTLDKIKSTFINEVINGKERNYEINDVIRKRLVAKTELKENIKKNETLAELLKELLSKLPENKSLWKYNMNAIKPLKPLIDSISDEIIKNGLEADYKALNDKLDELNNLYKEAYGGDNPRDKFKENKINELYEKMGNKVLKECIAITTPNNSVLNSFKIGDTKYTPKSSSRGLNLARMHYLAQRLKNSFKKDIESLKNQSIYEYNETMRELQEREQLNY